MKKSAKIVLFLIAALMAVLPALSGCGGDNGGGYLFPPPTSTVAQIVTCPVTPAATVTIGDNFFNPVNVSVAVDGVIEWTYPSGSMLHTVTSGTGTPDGKFNSGTLNPSGSVCMKFLVAGTYPYYCAFHGVAMSGTVTVTP